VALAFLGDKMLMPKKEACVRIIDIDGTVIKHMNPSKYKEAFPLEDAVETVNEWFQNGDIIIFWTARHPSYYDCTKQQLDSMGFYYNELLMGKPYAKEIHLYDDADIEFHKVERDKGLGILIREDK